MKRRIVSDSACNLRTLEGADFATVPITVVTAEREYVDNVDLDVEKMVQELHAHKGKSGTSCPSVGDWLHAFGDAEEIFCITITGALSGSHNSAVIAGHQYEEEHPGRRVLVLDSYSAGPEMKLLAEKLRELVLSEKDFSCIEKEIKDYRENKTCLVYSLESLKNLANNGRVSPAVAALAGIMGIRVIGDAAGGRLNPVDKCRGEKKAIASIISCMKERCYQGGEVVIDHCFNERGAAALKEALLREFPEAVVRIEATLGLCSFYAEKGGLMVGFLVNRQSCQ